MDERSQVEPHSAETSPAVSVVRARASTDAATNATRNAGMAVKAGQATRATIQNGRSGDVAIIERTAPAAASAQAPTATPNPTLGAVLRGDPRCGTCSEPK